MARLGKMYPHGKKGRELIDRLIYEIKKRENITLFTNSELVEKSGNIGDFHVKIRVKEPAESEIGVRVGAIIVATGFDPYQPREGEYGYGLEGVMTLPAFRELLDSSGGSLIYNGREIKDVVYIYCVGSRQMADLENANRYCSRYCCNATIHAANLAFEKNPGIRQFHLFRDIRTYGKFELLYQEALKRGTTFLKFDENEPPRIEQGENGKLKVTVKDLLTFGEEFEIRADVVVLATGMVPQKNGKLVDTLKLPVGRDGFFNEIHPKLRPVETVVDGIFICGACQGPKNSSESVASALAAVAQSASLLKKGYVELDPLVATVDPQLCTWCGVCVQACPYSAIEQERCQDREVVRVNEAVCKGCGGCVPICPRDALNLRGYTGEQIKSMIDGLVKEIC